jgi:PAS domain S-box-containing protein
VGTALGSGVSNIVMVGEFDVSALSKLFQSPDSTLAEAISATLTDLLQAYGATTAVLARPEAALLFRADAAAASDHSRSEKHLQALLAAAPEAAEGALVTTGSAKTAAARALTKAKAAACYLLRISPGRDAAQDLVFALLWQDPPAALTPYAQARLLLAGQSLCAATQRWQDRKPPAAAEMPPAMVERLAKVVQLSKNLIALVDADHNIEWVNPAFEQHTGWDLASIKGTPLAGLVRSPESDQTTIAALGEAIAQNKAFQGEIQNMRRNGESYWVEFNAFPLLDAENRLQGYVTIETDVTAARNQKAELEQMAAKASAAHTRLGNALAALPDGVIILDDDDRIVIANDAYKKMFPQLAHLAHEGTHLSELLLTGVKQGILGEGDNDEAKQKWLQSRMADYKRPSMIDETQLPDGRWVRRINQRTADGGCIAVGIDITVRKTQMAALDKANQDLTRALAAREKTEQRLRNIVQGTGVGTWEYDIPKQTVRTGGEYANILGAEAQDLALMSASQFEELVHPDDRHIVFLPNTKASPTRGDGLIEIEFRMRHADGSWRWVLSRGRVVQRDDQGDATQIVGVHMDITAQKQMQQELKISRDFLENLMEASVLALVVTDETGKIIYANAEAEQAFNLPHGGMIGLRNGSEEWRLLTLDGRPLAAQEMPSRRALAAGTQVRDIVYVTEHVSGLRKTLSANAAPLTGIDGSRRAVVTFSDISHQVEANKILHEALTRAEEANRAKSIFLANMSHEIRTPLNGVLGMTEVLEASLTDPDHRRMVTMIRSSGETLLTVLNNILDMSKIEAGKLSLEDIIFQPIELMRQSEALFSLMAQEKGLEMECLSSGKLTQQRLGDPHRIQQILNNLVHNAIKFTESGSVSLVLSAKTGRPLVIEVSDTGCGLSEDQITRMFNSFEQADGSITRRFGGTGLGLSIVKDLVRLMEGTIDVESAPGQGTTFRVTLPLAEISEQATPIHRPPPAEIADGMLEDKCFLIADDNATNRTVLLEMLAGSGATVVAVENGQLAVDAWEDAQTKARPFDVLLFDITMPVLDGVRALGEIRQREAERKLQPVPAIAVTANAMRHQVTEYIINGFDTHLSKPLRRKDLMHSLFTLIG